MHLSKNLKWAFLIACLLLVHLSVNFSHFQLLQNSLANFNQTWQKASVGKGDLSYFFSNEGLHAFLRGDNIKIFKISSLEPQGQFRPNLARQIRTINISKRRLCSFFSDNLCYDIIVALCKWVYWLKLFHKLSYLAHGPLVSIVIHIPCMMLQMLIFF